uniref:ENT domain-containing protein n=1 Tax=Kalanchoe fedtschenkoi TaxID=63787 RepID=A0A7N0UCJ7_KALFE
MEFAPYDSSDTDDDLPPSHQNRIPQGRLAGNGRSGVIASAPYSRVYGETDLETEIHNIEKEAYVSVLRAFKAQADVLTWEKEDIITLLRKEFRLSIEEHRELLGRANADDAIRRIREWRLASGVQSGISTNQAGHDPLPSPAVSASRKKQKVVQSGHQSFGGPSPPFHSQAPTSNPQSSSAAKKGLNIAAKAKKQKSGQMLSGLNATTKSMQFPPSGSAGRGQIASRVSSGVLANGPGEAKIDSLIGRKVKTRWPDDNNFYEAVITDFDPAQGRHALVYDMGSANETWEWVNLAEISPSDIRWEGGDPGIPRGGYGGPGHGVNRPVGHEGTSGAGRGRGLPKGHNRKDYSAAQNGASKKGSNIRILHTSHLIKEVERVFNSSNPDPVEIDKAKKALKEQEEALIDALGKLADISDAESD